MVGRRVEDDTVGIRQHHAGDHTTHLFTSGKYTHFLQQLFAGKQHPAQEAAPTQAGTGIFGERMHFIPSLQKSWREYCDGDVTEEQAMANFYALVSENYPTITTP